MNHRGLPGLFRSSHRMWPVKKVFLKSLQISQGKHLLESLFNKVAGFQACNFIKKRLQHWCFPVKFAKFLRTAIVKNIYERLLLFVSPQNTIANSSVEFGLYKALSESKYFFLNIILFDQMQPYHL